VTERFEEELTTVLARPGERSPSELFGDVSDDLWLWMNTEGYRHSPELRDILPALPDEEVQRQWTYRTGDETLLEGFGIYLLVRELYQRHVGPIDDAGGILDFGCGYGRVIRFFLRDVDHRRLTGTDNNGELIDFCRQSNRWCNFTQNEAEPPLPFEDDQFDYVFVYSVFSHFSEEMHWRWLEELKRVVRPGGALAISVRRRNFIEALREMRESGPEDDSQIILKMLVDTDRVLARYDAGEFCFEAYRDVQVQGPSEGGAIEDLDRPPEWWGEAQIPKAYVEREWGRLFEVVDFVEGSSLDLEAMRRAPHPTSEQSFVLLRA
jgi:SAM-dependent methyltransferase